EFIDLENNLKPYADTLRPSLLIADLSRQETGASQHKKRRITEEIDSSSQDPPITQGLEELESAEVTGDDDVQRTSPFSTHPSTTAQQSSPGFSSPRCSTNIFWLFFSSQCSSTIFWFFCYHYPNIIICR